ELDFRSLADRSLILDRKGGFDFRMENESRSQIGGEKSDGFVVLGDLIDIPLARHGDSIFSPLELALKITEILAGLQIRVILRDGQQTRQRRGELALRFLEFLKRGG